MDDARERVLRLARSLQADLVETHISWVLLTPQFAYKVKKPLRLPFLDYSTPERRLHFCEEEVRLNRRLAAPLYLGVSRITEGRQGPSIDGDGATVDYAVRMTRFPAGALFSERIEGGTLAPATVDRLAALLADFHAHAAPGEASPDPDAPLRRAHAALAGAQPLFAQGEAQALAAWLEREWQAARGVFLARLAQGKVRDGHGDLHLANIVVVDEEVAAFDCVEFDPALRALDLVDDAAFALMDFVARGRADLGWRFFNAWLERTGEYEGVPLLRFSLVGHALVRAQVEHLRTPHSPDAQRYARAALAWIAPSTPRLCITFGLPGSGKTYASQQLLERWGAVRIRSDVERKRAFGLDALAATRAHGVDAYTADATRRTYERLFALAAIVLRAGFPAVIDAAFLRRDERSAAAAVATDVHVPFSILACEAPLDVLRMRLRTRTGDASEADEAVLERLRTAAEPLSPDERRSVLAPS